MKYKIAICKITMVGSPALILGICNYDETNAFWQNRIMYTMEDFLNIKYTYDPNQEFAVYKSQEECDKAAEEMHKMAQAYRGKYHGKAVHFNSIDKDVKIYNDGRHDFNLDLAESVELTKEELILLQQELNAEHWQWFDSEDWGK